MFSSVEDIVKFVNDEKVEMVDFKVIDLIGRWRHVTIPAGQFSEKTIVNGVGIDASSYSGYKKVESGDANIIPDCTTGMVDPFSEIKTLSLICNIYGSDGTPYSRCPRSIAQKAEAYLSQTQKGKALFSPEIEFYLFDDLRYASSSNQAFYWFDTAEGCWNTGTEESPNLGYKFPQKGGYHGIPPADRTFNLRSEMVKAIEEAGIAVKYHHHEVGGPCQLEIEVLHDTLLRTADSIMVMKYIIKNIAYRNQKIATFMPKPIYDEGGNALHIHHYITDNGMSLFYDPEGYACLSKLALNHIGGLLKHGMALSGLVNPSTNSFKRLVPGYEAPTGLFFATGNRSAAVRIPGYHIMKEMTRVEYRPPDATCNPYLALSAILMAGLDGIENGIDPVAEGFGPFDMNVAEIPAEARAKVKDLPASLREALDALKHDHDFLLKGGVFNEDVINAWITYKMEEEVEPLQLRPHPYEFELYSDI